MFFIFFRLNQKHHLQIYYKHFYSCHERQIKKRHISSLIIWKGEVLSPKTIDKVKMYCCIVQSKLQEKRDINIIPKTTRSLLFKSKLDTLTNISHLSLQTNVKSFTMLSFIIDNLYCTSVIILIQGFILKSSITFLPFRFNTISI